MTVNVHIGSVVTYVDEAGARMPALVCAIWRGPTYEGPNGEPGLNLYTFERGMSRTLSVTEQDSSGPVYDPRRYPTDPKWFRWIGSVAHASRRTGPGRFWCEWPESCSASRLGDVVVLKESEARPDERYGKVWYPGLNAKALMVEEVPFSWHHTEMRRTVLYVDQDRPMNERGHPYVVVHGVGVLPDTSGDKYRIWEHHPDRSDP
jgi:hypothetical protein